MAAVAINSILWAARVDLLFSVGARTRGEAAMPRVYHLHVAQIFEVLLHEALLLDQARELFAVLVYLVEAVVEEGYLCLQLHRVLVLRRVAGLLTAQVVHVCLAVFRFTATITNNIFP